MECRLGSQRESRGRGGRRLALDRTVTSLNDPFSVKRLGFDLRGRRQGVV